MVAIQSYRTANHNSTRLAATLTELIVVIGIIGVLMSVLIPACLAARRSSQSINDSNNLRHVLLGIRHHENTSGKLPSKYRGGCGPNDGWVFSYLYAAGDMTLNAFAKEMPVESEVNLRAASANRPPIFGAASIDELPIGVRAIDAPAVVVDIEPTHLAFNAFLCGKRLNQLATSSTALMISVPQAGAWSLSPEFFSIAPPQTDEPTLIGFTDGSVDRRISLDGVCIEPKP